MRVQRRCDGTLAPAEKLPNGWLRVEGRTARVGILEYDNHDGTVRRELVLPEDLFDAESMRSAVGVPVTNNHPVALLDAQSARAHQAGSVCTEPRPDGDYLAAGMMITTADAVADIGRGKSQLSWGYDCEVDPPDPALVAKWGEHDGIQRRRIYNHLAVVDAARAGPGARMRLDAAGNIVAMQQPTVLPLVAPQQRTESPTMAAQIRIDGIALDATDANAPAIQQAVDRLIAESRTKLDAVLSKHAAEGKRADDAIKAFDTAKANVGKNWTRLRKLFDAMKTRMAVCDECGGAKMIDGKKCDYCDGAGKVLAHEAMKGEPIDKEMEDDGAAESLLAAEELGEPADVEAAEHKIDAAIKAAQKRRRDAIARTVARETGARVALETGARKFLGAEAKLDGKNADEVKSLVLAKLKPNFKLDGKSSAEIAIAYEMAIGEQPAAPPARNDGNANQLQRLDGDEFDVGKAQRVYLDNLKKATGPRA